MRKSDEEAGPLPDQPTPAITAQSTQPTMTRLDTKANEWYIPPVQPNYPSQPSPYMQQMDKLLMQQQQHTLALMLPQPELPTLAGDPIEYCSFIRAFESLTESRTDSSSARLYYLVQYTSGDVHELMRSCLSMNHTEGYHEARRLLKERYGQDYKIATAYVDRVTTGPQIRAEKAEDLRKFSTLITSCKNALRDIGYLNRINNPDCLKKIVDRLPFDMKRRWRDIADDISESKRREITIEDIAQFIEKKARSALRPIFGNISSPNTSNQGKQQKLGNRSGGSSGRRSTFGISGEQKGDSRQSASRNRPQCPLCNTNHWLSQCIEFRSPWMSA